MKREPQGPRTIDRSAKAPRTTSTTPVPFAGPAPCPPTADERQTLALRILQLLSAEPVAVVIASLELVITYITMLREKNPLQTFDESAAKERMAKIAAMLPVEAARVVH